MTPDTMPDERLDTVYSEVMVSQWSGGNGDAGDDTTVGSRHLPLSRAVVDALRAGIIGGDYGQGERLVEEEIAARFDVSRNPIREALRTLSIEGFVVIEPRRGARVASIDAARARELFELREPLEGLVAGLAAARRRPEHVARLVEIVAAGRAAADHHRLPDLPGLNTEFHETLALAAGNELLHGTLSRLSDLIRWVYAARISQRSTTSWDEHASIVDAIVDGDVERARQCGEAHIAAAANAYLLGTTP
jgi:DNA-binding GntR family transcriptional regulator